MKPLRFYEHFACAYGTIWLVMLVVALLTQSNIDTGAFGMFGFPVIALIYALFRRAGAQAAPKDDDVAGLQRRITQLEEDRNGQSEL